MSWTANSWRFAFVLSLAAASTATSCGGADDESGPLNDADDQSEEEDNDHGAGAPRLDASFSPPKQDAADASLPPEVEQPLSFETPQAGRSSVYVPDPTTNRVAVVNAGTFNVENVAVGTQPRFAATVPGQDVALVLNVGTRDAALLRTSEQGRTTVLRLDVGHDANAIAIAPDAKHALVYFNASAGTVGNADSFQDLTVVDLAAGAERSRRVSVGFKPRGVQFTRDGSRAFVITEDGISILDFAALDQGPKIARLVGLGDALSDAQSVDVQVTPDGAFALARRDTESTLRLIDLATGGIETLSLANAAPVFDVDAGVGSVAELTDLDLAPDGSFAIAVLRDRSALVRIPIPQGFRDASSLRVVSAPDALIGSVAISRGGTRAVGYTTAAPVESVTVFDLTSDALPRGIRLRKAVRAIAVSDDGSRVLVLHAPVGKGTEGDARIDASEGYSLVDTGSGFAKLQLTDARVASNRLLLTPDGRRVFALLSSNSVKSVEMADLDTFQVTSIGLSTPPNALGFVPGQARVFVGQSAQGGITFLDALSGKPVRTVSGFEIASRIRQ